MFRKLIVLTPVALILAAPVFPQESPEPPDRQEETPEFAAGVEVVDVDAVVTDKKGNPIRGLTQADFVIEEDGVPQEIVSFQAVELPELPVAEIPERPRISTNTEERDESGRTFIVVFDDVHLSPFQAERAKSAVVEFLKNGTRPGDNVTLLATGGGAWWTTRMPHGQPELIEMVGRLEGRNIEPYRGMDRMTDYEAMRIHLYRDGEVYARVHRRFDTYGVNPLAASNTGGIDGGYEDPLVYGRAAEVYYQSITKNRATLQMIERILKALETTSGRKSVVLVSEGFIYDPNLDEFKDVKEASRRSNAPIYFLDTRGLEGLPVYMSAEVGPPLEGPDLGRAFLDTLDASEGSESLALDTGGFTVKNTNDLAEGLQRIADDSRNYYVLGYLPSNTTADGKFRKIKVDVERDGVKVRARKGYYAPGRDTKEEEEGSTVDPQLQAALDSPWELDGVPLRMTAYVFEETLLGKARTMVVTEVDVTRFAFEDRLDVSSGEASGRRFTNAAEFFLVVAHRESGEFFQYDQKIDMRLRPETLKRVGAEWLPIIREFELAPGHYQAKIVVRDENAKVVGTLVHEFDVPELDTLRLSTPILTDVLRQKEGAQPIPRIVARRSFSNDGMLFSQFDVYGAARDTDSGMPRVRAGFEIRRKDGSVHTRQEPSPIKPTSLGHLSRLAGTRLDGAAPGEYELVLDVTDEVSGERLAVREPFELVAPDSTEVEFTDLRQGPPLGVTVGKYERLRKGMSYEEAVEVVGEDGIEESRTTEGTVTTVTTVVYTWTNKDGSKLTATFENGKLVKKEQAGLPSV